MAKYCLTPWFCVARLSAGGMAAVEAGRSDIAPLFWKRAGIDLRAQIDGIHEITEPELAAFASRTGSRHAAGVPKPVSACRAVQ
jgi:hypothetical protein